MTTSTLILGEEYDVVLRERVVQAILAMGGKSLNQNIALVGSQEIIESNFEIAGKVVKLEAETYVGLSITGSNDILEAIKALI